MEPTSLKAYMYIDVLNTSRKGFDKWRSQAWIIFHIEPGYSVMTVSYFFLVLGNFMRYPIKQVSRHQGLVIGNQQYVQYPRTSIKCATSLTITHWFEQYIYAEKVQKYFPHHETVSVLILPILLAKHSYWSKWNCHWSIYARHLTSVLTHKYPVEITYSGYCARNYFDMIFQI